MKYIFSIIAILIISFATAQYSGTSFASYVATDSLPKVKKPVIKPGLKSDTSKCVLLFNSGKYDSNGYRINRVFTTNSGQTYPKGQYFFDSKWVAVKDQDIFAIR